MTAHYQFIESFKNSYTSLFYLSLFIGINGCSRNGFEVNDLASKGFDIKNRSVNTDESGKLAGYITDAKSTTNGAYEVTGWACIKGTATSIPVHLYLGGSYGNGGTLITGYPADRDSGDKQSACGTSSKNYGFIFNIAAEVVAAHPGAAIVVHGIDGHENSPLGDSDKYRLPVLTTGPASQVSIPTSDQSPAASSSSTGQITDQKNQNPFRATNELTIVDPSKWPRAEYPGCVGKPNIFPPNCRGTTSIVGQHTYAQRLDFKGWGTEQGFCQGTTGTTPLIYATTNDAMNPASFNYQRLGGLDMAISEIPGDLNPADPNCKWSEAPNDIVAVRIAQKGFSRKRRACELTPGKMYYINVKPAGNETATCGLGAPEACLFAIYTEMIPMRSTFCR